MTKRLILFLSLFLYLNTQTGPLGPWLSKLTVNNILQNGDMSKLIVNSFVKQRLYQIRTLDQGNTSACTRHAIKNLIFTINALSRQKRPMIKQALRQNFNQQKFNKINKIICFHFGIKNILHDSITVRQMVESLNGLNSGIMQERYKQLYNILPKNIDNIMTKIMSQTLAPHNAQSVVMIFNKQFKSNENIIKILNGFVGGRELLNSIYKLKTSDKKILGIPLVVANDLQLKVYTHAVTLLIRKINKINFEVFILDSCNGNVSIPSVIFIKHLLNLPIKRIEKILNSNEPYLINYGY